MRHRINLSKDIILFSRKSLSGLFELYPAAVIPGGKEKRERSGTANAGQRVARANVLVKTSLAVVLTKRCSPLTGKKKSISIF